MDREINFRIWDEEKKKMYYASLNDVCDGIGFDYGITEEQSAFTDVDFLPVMQYTGLHDKSGREIYEGDIVDHYAFGDVVVFRNGMFTTERNGDNQPLYLHEPDKYCEVIGNIYENPDLLK